MIDRLPSRHLRFRRRTRTIPPGYPRALGQPGVSHESDNHTRPAARRCGTWRDNHLRRGIAGPGGLAVAANAVDCTSTVTTDTTNVGMSPASDRQYLVITTLRGLRRHHRCRRHSIWLWPRDWQPHKQRGQLADGRQQWHGASRFRQCSDPGRLPPHSPFSASTRRSIYSGSGTIINLDTGLDAHGLSVDTVGNNTGNVTAMVGGNVLVTAAGGIAIQAKHSGDAGNITVTTLAGTTHRAGGIGIFTSFINGLNPGVATIVNNGTDSGSPHRRTQYVGHRDQRSRNQREYRFDYQQRRHRGRQRPGRFPRDQRSERQRHGGTDDRSATVEHFFRWHRYYRAAYGYRPDDDQLQR